jgi:hypothetical protein
LEALKPDCILVEGPPDAEEVLPLADHAELKPPVALLIYDPEKPQRSAYFPFAAFSPEWQAIQFGLNNKVPVRFMDLPQSVQIALAAQAEAKSLTPAAETNALPDAAIGNADLAPPSEAADQSASCNPQSTIIQDPLASGPRCWVLGFGALVEHMVEHRREGGDVFAAYLKR